jgi:transposase InsO family protein
MGRLNHQLGVKIRFIMPYHTQSNGVVERFQRCLKDALQARMAGADRIKHLSWVLKGLREAPRKGLRHLSDRIGLWFSPFIASSISICRQAAA